MKFTDKPPVTLILFVVVALLAFCSGEIFSTLSQCCNQGSTSAELNRSCDGVQISGSALSPVPRRVERHLQAVCKSTLAICCLRTYRRRMCSAGIRAAGHSPNCIAPNGIGAEYFKDCCDACKLGVAVRSKSIGGDELSCQLNASFDLGSPWHEAFRQCCITGLDVASDRLQLLENNTVSTRKNVSSFLPVYDPAHPSPLPYNSDPLSSNTLDGAVDTCDRASRGRPCDHVCIDDPQGYYCQCRPGYRLQVDGKSCLLVNGRCSLNNPCDQLCEDTGEAIVCACRPGYALMEDGRSCQDEDECEEGSHDCLSVTERCMNTVGGYSCASIRRRFESKPLSDRMAHSRSGTEHLGVGDSDGPHPACPLGYEYSPHLDSCQDTDECALGMDGCDHGSQLCLNTIGSFLCVTKQPLVPCPPGHRYDEASNLCVDIDECTERLDACNRQREICLNLLGTYECHPRSGSTCPAGYKYDDVLETCDDINECQVDAHSCQATQRCDNTVGSFSCIRLTGCGTGYTLNAHTSHCEDDDECRLGNHNCGPAYECRNTLGSFRCERKTCPVGTRLVADGSCISMACGAGMEPNSEGQCVDVNECETDNPCRRNQRCTNSIGSHQCRDLINCGGGYTMDELGSRCVDIDECSTNTHDCRGNQQCINRAGGYICQCPAGHSLNAHNDCEDVDECVRYSGKACGNNAVCRNTIGSYVCDCNDGFQHGENNRTCVDVDECLSFANVCQHGCVNVWGSYLCTCLPGYTQGPDKRTCVDVDECSLYKDRGNLCVGICVNEPGSFSCSCPDGYTLSADKRTCQDVDECQQGSVCRGPDESCLNTRGSYRCNTLICPPEYIRDTNHKNRCKRESTICRQDDEECIKKPLSYSFNYLTFVSKLPIPPAGHVNLFTMRGPPFSDLSSEFSLELKEARAPPLTARPAIREYFQLRRTAFNQAVVSLVHTIEGPQEIELELVMNLYRGSVLGGTALAKIYVFVSSYEF